MKMENKLKKLAITQIENDLDTAYFIFGFLYKTMQSTTSIHNFGVFLSKYAQECSYVKSGRAFAIKLIKQAIIRQPNYFSLKELGDLYFLNKKYNLSIIQYKQASMYHKTAELLVNWANAYFYVGDYENCIQLLREANETFVLPLEQIYNTKILMGFSFIYLNKMENAKTILNSLTDEMLLELSPEALEIAYLCKDYDFIIRYYKEILKTWVVDKRIIQIIYQAYVHKNKSDMKKFITDYILTFGENIIQQDSEIKLKKDYNIQAMIQKPPCISDIRFLPQFWWQIDWM